MSASSAHPERATRFGWGKKSRGGWIAGVAVRVAALAEFRLSEHVVQGALHSWLDGHASCSEIQRQFSPKQPPSTALGLLRSRE